MNCSHDEFQFLENIGVGWFGKVDLAKWIEAIPECPCAIKIVEKKRAIELNQVSHLISERRLLLTLNNPFIVPW